MDVISFYYDVENYLTFCSLFAFSVLELPSGLTEAQKARAAHTPYIKHAYHLCELVYLSQRIKLVRTQCGENEIPTERNLIITKHFERAPYDNRNQS